MKCQKCDNAATQHITELVNGSPVEYHVCVEHAKDLEQGPPPRTFGIGGIFTDPELYLALEDREVRKKISARVLELFRVVLEDDQAEVRIQIIFRMLMLVYDGVAAELVVEILKASLTDPDPRVRKIAKAGIRELKSRKPSSE